MNSYYLLDIGDSKSDSESEISEIIGLESNYKGPGAWSYKIECDEDNYVDFADVFTKILISKYDKLASIGIMREEIIAWFVYYYEHQCDMEFTPQQLKLLGENGITFCISCYDVGEYNDDDEL